MLGFWTEARVTELARRWEGGDSARIIGRDMQMTRNAILGKVHRLGLERQSSMHRVVKRDPGRTTIKKVAYKKKAVSIVRANGNSNALRVISTAIVQEMRLRCVEIIPRNISLLDLTEQDCRYIAGEDYLYCGHPKMAGSSYCVPHNFLVWEKPRAPLPKRFSGVAA